MPSKTTARTKAGQRAATPPAADTLVACWEDDPGDPRSQPPLVPITVMVPNQSAQPLPFEVSGPRPVGNIYQPGTSGFLYYAAACALRRTADFWGRIVPQGTKWEVGKFLPVQVDSGVDLNAFYTRGGGGEPPGLHFFHEAVTGRVYFSGESPDVACHEMGHGVLDAIRPQLFDAQTIEAAAFHESFGDMSALLSVLQVQSFGQALLNETGGTINHASRLSRLAEQLGAAIRVQHPDAVDRDCLRNACNSFFYRDPQTLPPSAPASQLSSEPHSFSRVFTGAFLDALAGIFRVQGKTPSPEGLVKASQELGQILVGGVLGAPVVPDYYSQVAAHMVQIADGAPFGRKYRDILKSCFVRRGILSLQAAATLSSVKRRIVGSSVRLERAGSEGRKLPTASISAAQYGLNRAALKVYTAGEPKRFAVTSSSLTLGPVEPRSPQNAAESYTEDLFQRGHVDVGAHAHRVAGLTHPFSFKTHMIVEENGELLLKRTTFDCGFDHKGN